MQLYRFDPAVGHPIDRFGGKGLVLARGVRPGGRVQVGVMYLEPGGVVGHHPAAVPQLFMVVQGEGWVQGRETETLRIRAGQAAFWTAGEPHGAGTEEGMVAVVIEAEELNPAEFMPAVEVPET